MFEVIYKKRIIGDSNPWIGGSLYMLVLGWRILQSCPRRGRRAEARLILFILLIFIAPERFKIFHLHALTACLLCSPISPSVFDAILKKINIEDREFWYVNLLFLRVTPCPPWFILNF